MLPTKNVLLVFSAARGAWIVIYFQMFLLIETVLFFQNSFKNIYLKHIDSWRAGMKRAAGYLSLKPSKLVTLGRSTGHPGVFFWSGFKWLTGWHHKEKCKATKSSYDCTKEKEFRA